MNSGTAPQPNSLLCQVPLLEWHLVPKEGSFEVFYNDGTTIGHGPFGAQLVGDGGLSTGVSSSGSFAVATTSGLGEGNLEVVLTRQDSQVMAEIFGRRFPPTTVVSGTGETPVDPLAAVTCDVETFGVAYGLSGGNLVFRTLSISAEPGPERVIQTHLGGDITSLEMTLVGGNALIAAGTGTEIAVFAVPCS